MNILKLFFIALFEMFISVITLWILISFNFSYRAENFLFYMLGSICSLGFLISSFAKAKTLFNHKALQYIWFLVMNAAVASLAWNYGYFKMELTWLVR